MLSEEWSEAGNLGSKVGHRIPEMVNRISCREREIWETWCRSKKTQLKRPGQTIQESKEGKEEIQHWRNPEGSSDAAAKLLQSCPTLCNPIDGSPPGSPIPAVLQARTLEWVVISRGKWEKRLSVEGDQRNGLSNKEMVRGEVRYLSQRPEGQEVKFKKHYVLRDGSRKLWKVK